ncbi:MAG: hypothetical protein AB1567_04020, partial [bacterium]
PLQHSIFLTDTEKNVINYNMITEKKWREELSPKINGNVASEVLRELPKKETCIGFQTMQEFQGAMNELGVGVWEEYERRCQEREEGKKLIEKANITIPFKKYTSWETGLSFWILKEKEKVSPEIFSILQKCGLWNHNYIDEDNEERFLGWCFSGRDIEKTQVELAKYNIRMEEI